jgi:hypothetical protein
MRKVRGILLWGGRRGTGCENIILLEGSQVLPVRHSDKDSMIPNIHVIIFINSIHTSQETHHVSATEPSRGFSRS